MLKGSKRRRSTNVKDLDSALVDTPTAPPAWFLASISEYMSEIGRKGGKIGGKRRLKTMTAEQRKKLAAKAARARWRKSKQP